MRQIYDPSKSIVTSNPETVRHAFVVAGPPGTGKSTLLGSIAEVLGADRVLLLATHAREVDSWKYKALGIPRIEFYDEEWSPALKGPDGEVLTEGRYRATAFKRFLDTIDWLRSEEQYDAVIVDSGTELAEAGWRLALSPHAAGSPAEVDGKARWLPYEALDGFLDRAVKGLVSLTTNAKRPKHVGISWHVQPPKEDLEQMDSETKKRVIKTSSDNAGEGVEYEGKVLPMVRGRFRRRLAAQVPTMVYTDVKVEYETGSISMANRGMKVEFRLQVRPDLERHTKLPGPLPAVQYVPNDFASLLKLLNEQAAVGKRK